MLENKSTNSYLLVLLTVVLLRKQSTAESSNMKMEEEIVAEIEEQEVHIKVACGIRDANGVNVETGDENRNTEA